MKRNGIGVLVALLALTISGCTSTSKKKSRKQSSYQDSSELLGTSSTSGTSYNPTSQGGQTSTNPSSEGGTSEGTSVGPVSSATPQSSVAPVSSAGPQSSVPAISSAQPISSVTPASSSVAPSPSSATPNPSSATPSASSTIPTSSTVPTSSTPVVPPDENDYYKSISDSLTGSALLSALQQLNEDKLDTTVGYSAMGTTPSGQFKYTDYDPDTVQYDKNGQPYGTRLISFYSGNSAVSGMNREHVWPKSHGGNLVEADIHMPRPTIEAENGSRGNSFYVEGKCDGTYGWDPAMESFGDETYRGDSARIIFYCCVAEPRLSLTELEYHAATNNNRDNLMGKLSDMLKWHLEYSVQDREMRRNNGAEYLQGNRNPFIDHPEYACKIWGSTDSETKAVCGIS